MTRSRSLDRARQRVLITIFNLLYTRLGFLHETTGRVVYGAAWNGRRRHVVPVEARGTMLDIGCGEGRLLAKGLVENIPSFGVEPSIGMARRARRRSVSVIVATAQELPLRSGSVQHIFATYPGPWVIDAATWDELARVSRPGATVCLLLGGDIQRGPGAWFRKRLIRMAYGNADNAPASLPQLGNAHMTGRYEHVDDEWGRAVIWTGQRRD